MKSITIIFHPEDLSEARKHLCTLQGTFITTFMFRILTEHCNLEAGLNALEYILAGIPYHVIVYNSF